VSDRPALFHVDESMNSDAGFLRWYGERGIVNSLVSRLAVSPRSRVQALLRAIKWGHDVPSPWVDAVLGSTAFIEWGLADFGNPDLVLVISGADGPRCVFLEAMVGPYLSSMIHNVKGMREACAPQIFAAAVNTGLPVGAREPTKSGCPIRPYY
jgi:hypothetical protein